MSGLVWQREDAFYAVVSAVFLDLQSRVLLEKGIAFHHFSTCNLLYFVFGG